MLVCILFICGLYCFNAGGDDYSLGGTDLTIPSMGMLSMVSIDVTDDDILEGDETFTITLDISSLSTQYPDHTFRTSTTSTITILDDEGECV